MGSPHSKHKEPRRITMLGGGVGGARMARGLVAVGNDLTVIINVADDDTIYGLHVSADVDTMCYSLAGIEGDHGWGIRGDTFEVMALLDGLGVDTTFRLGDRDLAVCLARTQALDAGTTLSEFTSRLTARFGIDAKLLPASDDPVRTKVRIADGNRLPFQTYFVERGHRDRVVEVEFEGAEAARPAPGVIDAIATADLVVIGPSNPVLSIWPILAIPGIRDAVADRPVVAVSPLIGNKAVKGPAAELLDSLGYGANSKGVVAAYDGLVDTLVVDTIDRHDRVPGVTVRAADTHITTTEAAARLAAIL